MPRLYHTKSKTGCARCRARRVKCDEAKPKCGCCARHEVDCLYDRIDRAMSLKPNVTHVPDPVLHRAGTAAGQAAAHNDVHTEELTPLISAESRDRRYLELRLLHMWTTEVCETLPGGYDPQNLKIWSIDVPKIALDYEPLLTAIFSISLLYMVFSNSRVGIAEDELFAYRARYFEATLRHHRKALGSMDHRTANGASFTSIILIFDAFASLRERWIQPIHHSMPYKPPTEWLQMCRGARKVAALGLDMIGEDSDSSLSIMAKGAAAFIDPEIIYSEASRARFAHLLPKNADESQDGVDNEAYIRAVAYIGSVAAAKEAGEPPLITARRLTIFPIILHSRFLTLIDMLSPRAMVILAHYFALLCPLDGLWWIGNCPKKEIEAINSNLSSEWQGMMEWPLQVLRDHDKPSIVRGNEK
ncbi:uncharacterized protein TrAFT101_008464 [Trichoderma asperellum]|uniref:Zn(2)-C6 fungal-type domain-containing protein n=2 Tax=Trichoderma asperellum TaxID=101201 RepID=A0A2T3ZCC5_TRIA4|nr:hypothetical protein M441DRAFT_165680 [Trichoderma asperellum CBS 433.97]PTB42442.1 hypothetical protein M441DRAFT_165680 [Trichoderma asperellum CBS 433.97]UKZ93552.1 hypothetical protein TrAFT101_008464 [Trichoderma asperellum]